MLSVVQSWYHRTFSHPEAVVLSLFILISFLVVVFWGDILAPVFAALVIAYLLDVPVEWLNRMHLPHLVSVTLVFLLFCGLLVLAIFGLMPLLWEQAVNLIQELPNMFSAGQKLMEHMIMSYPDYLSTELLGTLLTTFKEQATSFGQWVISFSIASIPSLFIVSIYSVIVPMLVFFFLLDKYKLIHWFEVFIPTESRILPEVWRDINLQLGNYVRGKVIEIFILTLASYISFVILSLDYALLLSVIVGLSVIIPYIGAIVVTIPVVAIALIQWGWGGDFVTFIIVYTIIMTLDGNVLAPLLFSEAVQIHPVAIIVAILFFGGVWGFWGVFFAIPLAVGIKAIMACWPSDALEEVVST